jgi:hypothetical protein
MPAWSPNPKGGDRSRERFKLAGRRRHSAVREKPGPAAITPPRLCGRCGCPVGASRIRWRESEGRSAGERMGVLLARQAGLRATWKRTELVRYQNQPKGDNGAPLLPWRAGLGAPLRKAPGLRASTGTECQGSYDRPEAGPVTGCSGRCRPATCRNTTVKSLEILDVDSFRYTPRDEEPNDTHSWKRLLKDRRGRAEMRTCRQHIVE